MAPPADDPEATSRPVVWNCPACGKHNETPLNSCVYCNAPKPAGGEPTVQSSETTEQVTPNTKTGTRIACFCFLIFGAFVLSAAECLSWDIDREHITACQVWGMTYGICLGLPAALIAFPVGLFFAVRLWRSTLMKVLVLATVIFLPLFVSAVLFSKFFLAEHWGTVLWRIYGVTAIVASLLSLLRPASEGTPR